MELEKNSVKKIQNTLTPNGKIKNLFFSELGSNKYKKKNIILLFYYFKII